MMRTVAQRLLRMSTTTSSSSGPAMMRRCCNPARVVASTMSIRHFSSPAPAKTTATTTSTHGGTMLTALKEENPHVDVVQYKHKNRTWTLHHVDYYSEALAIGFAENGLIQGDIVVSWLPQHFSEQMVLQFACSKAGFVLYSLDPMLATTDKDKAQAALKAALTLTKANVLVSQEAGSDVNYIRLAESVVPELRFFDFDLGMPFVTPHFPHLRFCIHTGFDQEDKWGWIPLKHMVVPSNNLETHVDVNKINHGSTPLAGEFILDKDGIPTKLGKILTNEQVHQQKDYWPTYSKILQREFHQVEGVGVIW